MLRRWIPAVVVYVVTALATAAGLLAPAERLVGDLRAQLQSHAVKSDVVIVAIDAQSLKALNRWPWSRGVHAALLERLRRAAPRAVFFDVDFSVPSGSPAADAALAAALARPRGFPVVLPAFWQSAGAGTRGRRILTEPLPALARSARVGLVNVFPDDDGLVRDAVHRDGFGARDYRSASAILAGRNDLQNVTAYPIDFRIAPQSFTYVSYSDVLAGRVPDQAFTGRTVLVGATALELGDQVPVPVYRTIPGVTPPGPAVRESAPGPAAELPALATLALTGLVTLLWGTYDGTAGTLSSRSPQARWWP